MRDEIDFSQYDVNGNGFDDEPKFHTVHRENLPETITGGVQIQRGKSHLEKIQVKVEEERYSRRQKKFVTKKVTKLVTPPTVSYELLDHKEVGSFENGEASSIYGLAERIRNSNIVQLASQMHKLLGLPLEVVHMEMCAAWLRDTANQQIDSAEDEYVREPVLTEKHRYPRLTELAAQNMSAFRTFQKKINMHSIGIGDLCY